MKPRLTHLLGAAVVAAGFLTLSPRASAEFLTLQLDRTVPSSVSVNLGGNPINNVIPGPYFWHDTNIPPNSNFPAPIATFCIELTEPITVGNAYVFGVVAPEAAPTIGTAAKADSIRALYGNFYDPNWASNGFTGSLESTAFQLALWELVYETDPTKTLDSGNFNFLPGVTEATKTRANEMLAGLAGGLAAYNSANYELVALIAPAPGSEKQTPGQDQLIVRPKSVPAPPAALLAGIGVLALVGRARLNRRAPATA